MYYDSLPIENKEPYVSIDSTDRAVRLNIYIQSGEIGAIHKLGKIPAAHTWNYNNSRTYEMTRMMAPHRKTYEQRAAAYYRPAFMHI